MGPEKLISSISSPSSSHLRYRYEATMSTQGAALNPTPTLAAQARPGQTPVQSSGQIRDCRPVCAKQNGISLTSGIICKLCLVKHSRGAHGWPGATTTLKACSGLPHGGCLGDWGDPTDKICVNDKYDRRLQISSLLS